MLKETPVDLTPALRSQPMATTLRITLLAGTYGATVSDHLDYPPCPHLLLRPLQQSNPDLVPIIQRLNNHRPVFHLPYGTYRGSHNYATHHSLQPIELGVGAVIHISWPIDLTSDEERSLSAALADQHCIGRPEDTAIWQVVPIMPEPNCIPSSDGSILLTCADGDSALTLQVRYRYNPSRSLPRPDVLPSVQANRALYAVPLTEALPSRTGIVWTDRLHRALLRLSPSSGLFAGLVGGRPLPEDQRAWYRWEARNGLISQLEVFSPLPFDAAELEALHGLRHLFGYGGITIPLQLLQLDAQPLIKARSCRTAIPMLLYTTPRASKPSRSVAAQAIQTLLWGDGERDKIPPEAFRQNGNDDTIVLDHCRYGRITASVLPAAGESLLSRRGDRQAASSLAHHVSLNADESLPLLGVGWGRHFGAGRLEAMP